MEVSCTDGRIVDRSYWHPVKAEHGATCSRCGTDARELHRVDGKGHLCDRCWDRVTGGFEAK